MRKHFVGFDDDEEDDFATPQPKKQKTEEFSISCNDHEAKNKMYKCTKAVVVAVSDPVHDILGKY